MSNLIEFSDLIEFVISDTVEGCAILDEPFDGRAPLDSCEVVRRGRSRGVRWTRYRATRESALFVLHVIEGCPADQGMGCYGGEYREVQAVWRAVDRLRSALGMSALVRWR